MTLDELQTSPRAVISVAEAARLLELDERSVRKGCESGEVPNRRVGRRILIPRVPFIEWLHNCYQGQLGAANLSDDDPTCLLDRLDGGTAA
jgi:excisionase family DNA binding protein